MRATSIPIIDLVQNVVSDAKLRAEALGINLTFSDRSNHRALMVIGDATRLDQLFGNLIDNALKHTAAGGSVTVTVNGGDTDAQIMVSDDGEGIPLEHLPHLFERFYRVDSGRDRAHGGSGIGLAIVKALAGAHGGSVEAFSPGSGQGADFTVRLPLASQR
jgi:signal transduction histidine kinase